MKANLVEAAQHLYKSVKMPAGSFNVIPLDDANGMHIVVWVDNSLNNRLVQTIPTSFEGYPVTVVHRPMIFGQ